MTLDPTWDEIIRAKIRQSLDGLHTGCPGIVRSYDRVLQSAEIDLCVDIGAPALLDVPVVHPGGGGAFMHFELTSGDTGWVHFSEVDFSGWYSTTRVSPPAIVQRHGLYSVFVPGLRPLARPLPVASISGACLGSTTGAIALLGATVSIQATPIANPITPAGALVKATVFEQYATALESALDGVAPGSGSALAALRVGIATTALESE